MSKPQLHWSHLSALSLCGERFRLSYIEKKRVRPGIAAAVGSGVHAVAAENLTEKSEGRALLSLEHIRDSARDAFERQWQEGVDLTEEEVARGSAQTQGEAIDRTVRLSEVHATQLAPILSPKVGGVERAWVVKVDGFPFDLAGEIDVQEEIVRPELDGGPGSIVTTIRDLKTSGKMPSARLSAVSGQLTMYAIAAEALDGVFPDRVGLDYVTESKGRLSAGSFTSERRPEHVEAFWRRLERAAEVIEKQIFTPTDPLNSWVCSTRWCGYARTNPDTGRPYCDFFAEARVFFGPGLTPANINGGYFNVRTSTRRKIVSEADRAALVAGL